jgi:hypothetical protein
MASSNWLLQNNTNNNAALGDTEDFNAAGMRHPSGSGSGSAWAEEAYFGGLDISPPATWRAFERRRLGVQSDRDIEMDKVRDTEIPTDKSNISSSRQPNVTPTATSSPVDVFLGDRDTTQVQCIRMALSLNNQTSNKYV